MRKLASSMAVAALLCAPLGCNKNSDQPRSPATTTPTTTTTPPTSTTTSEPEMTPAAGESDFGSEIESDFGAGSDTSGTWGSDTSEPSIEPGATPELRGGDAGVKDDTQSPETPPTH